MKLTCAVLAGMMWAGTALASGPVSDAEEPKDEAAEDVIVTYRVPPSYPTSMPAARHRFSTAIMEDMRRKILIKTGQLDEEPEIAGASKPSGSH